LIGVTAVARVLPRSWDGPRLLRFLTGLAMLALAFTAPASTLPPAPAPTAATAPALAAPAPAAPAARAAVPATATAATFDPAPIVAGEPLQAAAVLTAVRSVLPAAFALRVRGERAPPAAA
jgi:hypothetical protein